MLTLCTTDYVNGPTGPKSKNLDRKEICQNEGICIVQPSLAMKLNGVHGEWDEELPWPDQNSELEAETGDDITRAEVDYAH